MCRRPRTLSECAPTTLAPPAQTFISATDSPAYRGNRGKGFFHITSSRRRWPAHTPRERTDLKLSTVSDGDLLGGLARLAAVALDRLDDVHALHNLSEDHMALVQPGRLHGADEELRAVGVGSGVGHAQDSGSGVLQREVLILELVAVDGLSASAVVVGEVATCGLEFY